MKSLNSATWARMRQPSEFDITETQKSFKTQLKKSMIDQIMHTHPVTSTLRGSIEDSPKLWILDTYKHKHISQ